MKKFLLLGLILASSLSMAASKNYNTEAIRKDLTAKGYTITKENDTQYIITKGATKLELTQYETRNKSTEGFAKLLKGSFDKNNLVSPNKSKINKGLFVFQDGKNKENFYVYALGELLPTIVVNATGSEPELKEIFNVLKSNKKTPIDDFQMEGNDN